MTLELVAGSVVTVISSVVAVAAVLDRRVRTQVEIWRGIADARAAEAHDCNARLERIEAELSVLRGEWMAGVAAGIADRVATELRRRAPPGS